jgi:hypothetical protein
MPHEAQAALAPGDLSVKPCVGIGRRGMRFAGALLLVEVALAVAAGGGRFAYTLTFNADATADSNYMSLK